ncbi:MAG: alpha-glucosidase C-terminal domain-containing protein [Cyclobacteriaceae bacterium]|nr:alpha-glucosidase C-terminal domain-containing protein [Cyclobacteriaceae bacterium]
MKKILIALLVLFSLHLQAQEVIYHVFQRSFFDSNGDGHGDLPGMKQKLDYLQELGVTSILLTPLYQSEFYHNYFATDFEKIDPAYGTLDEYVELVKEVHKRGMKIYQDVEMQYVTHEHPWYIDSFDNPKSPFSDYLYYDDSLNQKPFFFYNIPEFTTYTNSKQKIIVVNMNNPAVRNYTFDVLNFWLDPNGDGKFDDGVDGFRLDHMMDDLDNMGKVTNLFRDFWVPVLNDLRKTNPDIKIIAEQANWFSLGREYFREANVDRVFAFYLSWAIEQFNKKELTKAADSTLTKNPEGKEQIVFIENHDTRRFGSVVGMTDEKLKVAASLNMLLGGIPLLYYGQEIGMKGKQIEGDTDGNDIPMREAFEWTASAEGTGMALWYKDTGPWWDSTNVKPYDGISLEEQRGNPASLWNHYKKMIELKKTVPALTVGKYQVIENNNDNVFSFLRYTNNQKVLVVVNLSDKNQVAGVQLIAIEKVKKAEPLFNGTLLKFKKQKPLTLNIKPYEVQLYELK